MKNIYYNPIAENALELAEKNIEFYTSLVQEYKPSHRSLWPSLQIEQIITDVQEFQKYSTSTIVQNKCCAIVLLYTRIYEALTYEK